MTALLEGWSLMFGVRLHFAFVAQSVVGIFALNFSAMLTSPGISKPPVVRQVFGLC